MGKNHKKLINNLEKLRMAAGITQQELSESANVSRVSINAIENGVYVPSTVLALKIAKTLNCKVEDVFQFHNHSIINLFSELSSTTSTSAACSTSAASTSISTICRRDRSSSSSNIAYYSSH